MFDRSRELPRDAKHCLEALVCWVRGHAERVGHRPAMMLIPCWWQNSTAFAELLDGRRRVQPSAGTPAAEHSPAIPCAMSVARRPRPRRTLAYRAHRRVAAVALDLRGVRGKCEDVVARVSEPDRSGWPAAWGRVTRPTRRSRVGRRNSPAASPRLPCCGAPIAWSLAASQPSLSAAMSAPAGMVVAADASGAVMWGDRDHGSVRAHSTGPRCPAGEPLP